MRRPRRDSNDPVTLAAIAAEVRTFATRPTKTFFELGIALATLFEHHPQAFAQVIAEAGISRRRAYYVLGLRERFAPFMAHEGRLRAIGWTKLTVLAPFITSENIEEMLALAETNSAKRLAQVVAGVTQPPVLRCVLLYLAPQDYVRFSEVVIQHGGKRRGRQLIGSEAALMTIIARLPQ